MSYNKLLWAEMFISSTKCQVLGVMFVRELASRMPNPTPVSVSAVNPGLCNSRINRSVESNIVVKVIVRVLMLLARTSEMGSRTLVHPAVEPGERARHGRYVSSCEVSEESDYVLSEEGKEISRRVWVSVSSALRVCRTSLVDADSFA